MFPDVDKYTLPCGHTACRNCVKDHLLDKIKNHPRDVPLTRCFYEGCNYCIPLPIWKDLGGKEFKRQYMLNVFRRFCDDSRDFRFGTFFLACL